MPLNRTVLAWSAALSLTIVVGGCVVAPVPGPGPRYAPPPPPPAGVVYVAPTYPMPSPGFVWAYHPQFGWGWHHPNQGWHHGWR